MKYLIKAERNSRLVTQSQADSYEQLPSMGAFKSIREVVDLPRFTSGTFQFEENGITTVITIVKIATDDERDQNETDRRNRLEHFAPAPA